ncbi:MAG: sugar O-acetyltransferase [Mobiluncus porci]|uniref:sugar O-acetyltransferase n=1 Tax=Mobiluncus porci TaxID=2652278 RepID=UPI0023F1B3F2|nr:sugar O-acetyltransferase [Mobiluncus porci]MDD7541480.1 sugar O-acetyltransferase [Mobiluncus porci]MDY5748465.1 sugar O-acetyltransferase [Mobiluncus porci]
MEQDNPTMYERMRAGELYKFAGPEFERLGAESAKHMVHYNTLTTAPREEVDAALQEMFGKVGPGVTIRPPLYIDYGIHTTIGEGTFMNFGCVLLDVADITIGARCQFAPGVQLLTAWHPLEATTRRDGWEAGTPITIGDNVWLGANTLVLPGVTIGENTVVGAGSVVTRDLPANVIAFGNPARVQRRLPEERE